METKISNKIVIAMVLIAMLISVIGTIVVTTTYEKAQQDQGNSFSYGTGTNGFVSLDVYGGMAGNLKMDVINPNEELLNE